jgi:hypothetical protein
VTDGRRADFEAVFALGGIWTRLLSQSAGYWLTEITCESPESRQYRVRDFWDWHRSFENFRLRFQLEYERFGSWILSEGLIEKEQFLGAYYESSDDDSEDEGLVLS